MSQFQKTDGAYIKGRGAQINPANPFDDSIREHGGQVWFDEDEMSSLRTTQYLETHPKSILNKVDSPDIGMSYSMNPYQGCEHGCIYCYARNTHTFWGYSSGIDFEQKILVKKNAPTILDEKLAGKNWKPMPIMFSGNTDCYQPAEKKFRLTRQMLEVLWKWKHPAGIITKSALILRDIDLLSKMAEHELVQVAVSLTTLDETLRQKLEPRTASGKKRLDVVKKLTDAGVPVKVMLAPIIPSLNDTEIHQMAKAAADAGALSINHIVVRLNGDIGEIFKDWLYRNFPDRFERVLHQIESCHGGKLNDSRFGLRMRGEGNIADIIQQQVRLMREQYFKDRKVPQYNLSAYQQVKDPQIKLF